jgi:hypothetical protein
MTEILFEEITKTERDKIKKQIIKDIKDEFEKMIEKEVLKQLKNSTKDGHKIVKEIIATSLISLFKTLWVRSNLLKML